MTSSWASEQFAINCASDFLSLLGVEHEKYRYSIRMFLKGVEFENCPVGVSIASTAISGYAVRFEIMLFKKLKGDYDGIVSGVKHNELVPVERDVCKYTIDLIDHIGGRLTTRTCELCVQIEDLKRSLLGLESSEEEND